MPAPAPRCAWLLLGLLLVACARNPAQVAWDDAFATTLRALAAPSPPSSSAAPPSVTPLLELAATAPRAVDAGAARLEAARILRDRGEPLAAARLFLDIAETAPRRADRARARYELARMAEARGRIDAARDLYRAIVLRYPDLMPGERSLEHLLRLARDEDERRAATPDRAPSPSRDRAVDAHLAWTRSIAQTLAHTELADNLAMQPADEAKRRAERDERPADWALAEALYRRVTELPSNSGMWNDAWWELSWIFHRQRRFQDEIAAIRRILLTRAEVSLFGQDEHPYFYLGLQRIARLQLVELDDPLAAASTYLSYAERYPRSILKDDVRFFALCATLRAQRDASPLRALLIAEHPDSKYLRRLELAFADPRGPHCLPPPLREDRR